MKEPLACRVEVTVSWKCPGCGAWCVAMLDEAEENVRQTKPHQRSGSQNLCTATFLVRLTNWVGATVEQCES
jgi:hypothetical protein